MSTMNIFDFWNVNIGGEYKTGGSVSDPNQISSLNEVFEARLQITNSSGDNYNLVTVWQNGDAGVDDFDFLFVETDADVLVEFTIDRGGTPEYATIKVPANHTLLMAADDMLIGALTDGSVETMDQIDQIRVKNDADGTSADVTATVRVVLLT